MHGEDPAGGLRSSEGVLPLRADLGPSHPKAAIAWLQDWLDPLPRLPKVWLSGSLSYSAEVFLN